MRLHPMLILGLGGAAGAICRYQVGLVCARRLGTSWPYGTLVINLSGCFLIGVLTTLMSERLKLGESFRLGFPIGFVGAYTTFSTYAYETLRLLEGRAVLKAVAYVALSNLLGLAAVAGAVWLSRRL